MKRELRSDLEQLQKFAFRQKDRCGSLLEQFHANRLRIDSRKASAEIWQIYDWLCVPYSLWPVDFVGLAKHLLNLVNKKRQLDHDTVLLIGLIGQPPDSVTCDIVGAFEHVMEAGNYDDLVRQPEKFKEHECELKRDAQLKTAWNEIKKRWDVPTYQNSRGVIRRRMSQERNFRENWDFAWKDSKRKFHLFFDAMCYRWKLYGMQHDDPLLLKISVNPTPHGTMIVIPRNWSLDLARDLYWNKIGKLHRAHKALRQGPKFSPSRTKTHEEAEQVLKFWNEAGTKNIRGDARCDFVLEKMKKDKRNDYSWVKRRLAIARGKKK